MFTKNATIRTVDMTPTWEQSLSLLLVVFENGTPEGRAEAKKEILRAGRILDHIRKEASDVKDGLDAALHRRLEQNGRSAHGIAA